MPKKTREQKIKAAERRSQQAPSLNNKIVFSEKKPVSEHIKSEAKSDQYDQYEQTESEKNIRKYFMIDFRKSLFITLLIIFFELLIKMVELDRLIGRYLKI